MKAQTASCRRETARVMVDRASTVRAAGATPRDVTVEDLSSAGFSFTTDIPISTGTLVHVGLAGAGTASAQVTWRRGDRHGCLFQPPLSLSQIEKAFTHSSADPVIVLLMSGDPAAELASPSVAPETDAVPVSVPVPVAGRLILLAIVSGLGWAAIAAGLRSLPL